MKTELISKISTFIIITVVIFFILMVNGCVVFNNKVDLKSLTQALSENSSDMNVKVEIGPWGTTITVEANGVSREWLQSEECWESK